MTPGFRFHVHCVDAHSSARTGTLHTPRGDVQTPAFMPVGTQGTVKGLLIEQVRQTGAELILANTYHLMLRPGEKVVCQLGGLHRFMGWDGPILTDSGGFQIYSLAHSAHVTDEGAHFQSHIDGAHVLLTPERALQVQQDLGSDIAMVLDHVVPLPSPHSVVLDACQRTIRWAQRSLRVPRPPQQALFAILQGGLDPDLRLHCAQQLVPLQFDGYAIGGLSVGEQVDQMYQTLQLVCPVLPGDRPRYLMGVGRPEDLLQAVRYGVDLFDCVMPTRNGRNALAFTDQRPLRLRNQCHRMDDRPIMSDCPCAACRYSRGYIRHLFLASEMLGPILLSIHNLTYYQQLLGRARSAIRQGRFAEFCARQEAGWSQESE